MVKALRAKLCSVSKKSCSLGYDVSSKAFVIEGGELQDPLHSHPFSTLCCPKPGPRARHQRQPLAARHAALLHPHARTVITRCDTGLTIRIGAAVDRIVDHPVDGGVARPAPSDVAVVAFCGQI